MKDFFKLNVWNFVPVLTVSIYKPTRLFLDKEKYELVSQIPGVASLVSANNAEGFG